jgi:hypothetical protein
MAKPRATWVLWLKWVNRGWTQECKFVSCEWPGAPGKKYASIAAEDWKKRWKWNKERCVCILPDGRKPKGAK